MMGIAQAQCGYRTACTASHADMCVELMLMHEIWCCATVQTAIFTEVRSVQQLL